MTKKEVEACEAELKKEDKYRDLGKDDLRKMAEEDYIKHFVKSFYLGDKVTKEKREASLELRKKAVKVFAWLCSTASRLDLPYSADLVFKGLATIFNQYSVKLEVDDDVMSLFLDLALLMEIMNALDGSGGFTGGNTEFWEQAAGKLHMAVLNRAVDGCKGACLGWQRQNALVK